MKPCIVSFSSTGRENYNKAMLGLIRSIEGMEIDTLMYSFDGYVEKYNGVKIDLGQSLIYPQNKKFECYNHQEVPYQFKLSMIQRARDKGYDQVIWCDSTIRVKQDLTPLLDKANKQGIVVFDNLGHLLYNWISDVACKNIGLDYDTLKDVPQIMACCIIFDFTNKVACEIFDEWVRYSQDGVSFQNYGSSRDGFKSHRHDQAILSYLVWKRNISFEPYGTMIYRPHDVTKEFGDNYYLINYGVD